MLVIISFIAEIVFVISICICSIKSKYLLKYLEKNYPQKRWELNGYKFFKFLGSPEYYGDIKVKKLKKSINMYFMIIGIMALVSAIFLYIEFSILLKVN
jgi:hypothetical protein